MSLSDVLARLRRVSPRVWVRTGFFVVFVASCWQLRRYYQWALGNGAPVAHPEATAGLVPLGALMSLIAWMKSGVFDPIMPASVVIILAAATLSVVLKRGFCGYVCPVGASVSAIGWAGRLLRRGRPARINRWVDISLRVPKYFLAAAILGVVAVMPVQQALDFQNLPYYATADLKILYGIIHPALGYVVFVGFFALTTLLIGTNTWCRYMCPLGALYGGLSAASPSTVKRDAEKCIDCKACDKACAARIEVSTTTRAVRDPECDGCQDCVMVCPQPGALDARIGGAKVPWRFWVVTVVVVWTFAVAIAAGTGHWQQGLPDSTIAQYMREMKLTADWQQQSR